MLAIVTLATTPTVFAANLTPRRGVEVPDSTGSEETRTAIVRICRASRKGFSHVPSRTEPRLSRGGSSAALAIYAANSGETANTSTPVLFLASPALPAIVGRCIWYCKYAIETHAHVNWIYYIHTQFL